ncbi:MAG: hypothetical protein HZB36_06075 [Candidatus Omnitrophica bacterium]|nr:hypothetical protein [Candidatus Omnitrophota bacterium]
MMSWKKRSAKYSLIWFIFLVIWTIGAAWYISSHPLANSALTQEQRLEKLGEAVGKALFWGIGGIWLYGYVMNVRKKQD